MSSKLLTRLLHVTRASQLTPTRGIFTQRSASSPQRFSSLFSARLLATEPSKPSSGVARFAAATVGILFGSSIVGGAVYLGRPYEEVYKCVRLFTIQGDTNSQHKSYSESATVTQYFLRAKDRAGELWNTYANPTPEHLLPPPPPYLPNDYVLVLAVEDFLIHSDFENASKGWEINKRPHLDVFLAYCLNLFGEVVLFSSSNITESAAILQRLDPDNGMHKLFKTDMHYVGGSHVKDLTLLDRDLKKVILLDINKDNFRLTPNNGLVLKPFLNTRDQDNDRTLLELIPLLQAIVQVQPDIREIVKNFSSVEDIATALADRRHARIQQLKEQQELQQVPTRPTPEKRNRIASWLFPSK